jgi:hypothetical protein
MNPSTKKTLIIVLIVLLVLCLCAAALVLLGGIALFKNNLSPTIAAQLTPEQPISTATALPKASPESSEDAISASMDEIERQVSAIRGLKLDNAIPRKLLTEEELQATVENDFFKDYSAEDAASDARVLSLLGLLPRDFDLLSFYQQLYSEQIAGYYDDEVKAMFVVKNSGFTGVERDTYAHEFTHALQDAAFDFNGALNYTDEACQEDSERCAALQSLIEGDATLTESLWLQSHATKQDIRDLQNFYAVYESPVYDAAPAYMQEDFLFAYQQGYAFVQSLYEQGGFAAVDKAYTSVQPASTEQIMHPKRYPADIPVKVDLPDLSAALGSGWEESDRNIMGEWYTWLILARGDDAESRLVDAKASAAAEGWGGDTYVVLENTSSGEAALLVRYTWDGSSDSAEAKLAFESYLNLRLGSPDQSGIFEKDGVYSALRQDSQFGFTWLIADSRAALETLLSELY